MKKRPMTYILAIVAVYGAVWLWYEIHPIPVRPTVSGAAGPTADATSDLPIQPSFDPSKQAPAPEVTIRQLDGKLLTLSSLKGKVVLLDFWATWCGPCAKSIPSVQAVYGKYHEKGFEVLGVALEHDSGEKIPGFVKMMGMTYPVGLPTIKEQIDAYDTSSIPLTVLVDRKGIIRWGQQGYDPDGETQLTSNVEMLLKEGG